MKRYMLILLLTVLFSCSKDQDNSIDTNSLSGIIEANCGENPSTVIKEKIELLINDTSILKDYLFVFKGNYQGKTVFVFGNCCPFCNSLPPEVLDCSGDFLGYIDYTNSQEGDVIANEKVTNRTAIWPETPICGFGG